MMLITVIKVFIPIGIGFAIGSLLSLAVFPAVVRLGQQQQKGTGDCGGTLTTTGGEDEDVNSTTTPDGSLPTMDEVTEGLRQLHFEVRVLPPLTAQEAGKAPKRLQRPRFYANELGIKEKLYVAISTTAAQIPLLSTALNLTNSHHLTKLEFFVSSSESLALPKSLTAIQLSVVAEDGMTSANRPLVMLNHMIRKGVHFNYDWLFLAPDTTYVKGFALAELVSHLSVGYTVAIGKIDNNNGYQCSYDAGILLSSRLVAAIEKCVPNIGSVSRFTKLLEFDLQGDRSMH